MVSRRLITSKRRGALWLVLALLLRVDLYAHVASAPQTVQVAAPPNLKAPDFTLLNQEGERFVSTALRGKIVVLDFFTPHAQTSVPCSRQTLLSSSGR